MKPKDLHQLAADPRFIPGVYNYCDRWCERCPLSNRCFNRASDQAEDDGDPAGRDLSNQKFWDRLQRNFQSTLEMLRADAEARGIDLDDPKLQAQVKAQEEELLPLGRGAAGEEGGDAAQPGDGRRSGGRRGEELPPAEPAFVAV